VVLADLDVGFDIGADDVCVADGSGEPPAFKFSSFKLQLPFGAPCRIQAYCHWRHWSLRFAQRHARSNF
jgi:hypothetical protein